MVCTIRITPPQEGFCISRGPLSVTNDKVEGVHLVRTPPRNGKRLGVFGSRWRVLEVKEFGLHNRCEAHDVNDFRTNGAARPIGSIITRHVVDAYLKD